MIKIKLGAGLGNNMFQYAAARSIAEKNNYDFCYFPVRGFEYWKTRAKKLLALILHGHKDEYTKQINKHGLSKYFTLGNESKVKLILLRLSWICNRSKTITSFTVEQKRYSDKHSFPIYDPRAFDVPDWTEMNSGFQSLGYIKDNRKAVLEWFTLNNRYLKKLNRIEQHFPKTIESRCCIHIRRGDYLYQDKHLGWSEQGWLLPIEYYKYALEILPSNLFYIFISDDPGFVRKEFSFLKEIYVASGNPEAIDMFLLTKCKFNIIANSSFSWWGAWLNQTDGKVVIAPKYHIGWTKKEWLPWGFGVHPSDWTYVDVLEVLNVKKL